MHKKVLYIILVWCYILTPFLGHAQTVALVLSGGGAKAYSHIGVLKAIEEANIEVDYIVGNSMGALIGAFYSSGYSPSEIESILTNPDFLSFTRENTDKTACYYQNVESDASFVNFTFDVEKG
ncbi:MAG: patatin, partial [Lentimicrobiaceae bacterium]|nr:patatin [Lentimicrobiaceae bacterium]MBT3819028.1 patatin [Lentimicrobiaceae bacterium]MBT4061976.1 patatin [Lentimicrobiaceae bacterium]MBT4191561.1 patatin [Lentimicrobiaceae bacterium]MBT4467147.1 patatin [Lentimicrobiaceae bacterium]